MSFNFSNITGDLFIGTTPLASDYDGLRELGIGLIINMRLMHGPFPDSYHMPLKLLWLRTFDSPFFPIPTSKLMLGAKAALETVHAGNKVYVHCAGGRHRGVAMGACVLIAQGYDPDDAMKLIMERRSVADPYAYYIHPRIMKFAHEWNKPSSATQARIEQSRNDTKITKD